VNETASRGNDDALTSRLRACYSGAVHDVLRAGGCESVVMHAAIKAVAP
jgi:hypothetical protein